MSDAVLGPVDPSLADHLSGEWRAVDDDEVECQACGARVATSDPVAARAHWQVHVAAPSRSGDFQMVWYVRQAGGPGKSIARGSVAAFLAQVMGRSYLAPEVPMPLREVAQQFVDQGELNEGMNGGYDWPQFEVTDEIYDAAKTELTSAALVAPGSDPGWANTLFFRRAECLAAKRGTDVHREIRRMTILNESAAMQIRFAHLDEVVRAARRRSQAAQSYDFDQPLDPFDA